MKAQTIALFDVQGTVDSLGEVKAQLAQLSAKEKQLKEQLISYSKFTNTSAFDGVYFRATVASSLRQTVAWKTLVEDLGLSEADLDPYKSESTVVSVRVNARIK